LERAAFEGADNKYFLAEKKIQELVIFFVFIKPVLRGGGSLKLGSPVGGRS
jgi:hypothetical protein